MSSFTVLKRPQINNEQASIKLANIWTRLGRFIAENEFQQARKKLTTTTSARLNARIKGLNTTN